MSIGIFSDPEAMTDLMVPSKRPRAPSFSEKHPESHAAAVSDSLPEKQIADDQVQVRNFLELCRFCKKSLRHDEDVFMYGYLGAFCSKECRAKQMACDIFMELSRHKSKPKKGRTSNDEGFERITPSSRFYI